MSIKRMDKAVVVYMHRLECMYTMEYYPAIKKESLPFVTTWINLRGITLSEVRERQILFDELTYTWNLKTTTTQSPKLSETESRSVAVRAGYGEEQLDEGGQKVHTSR